MKNQTMLVHVKEIKKKKKLFIQNWWLNGLGAFNDLGLVVSICKFRPFFNKVSHAKALRKEFKQRIAFWEPFTDTFSALA